MPVQPPGQPGVPHDPDIEIVERGIRPSLTRRVLGVLFLLVLAGTLWITTDRQTILDWKREAGPVPFFLALAVLPALGFPTTPFFVLAGALYGVWTALIGSAIAIAANLALCYWISHSGLRPWLERRMSRTRYKIPDLSRSRAGAIRFTLLVKVAPGLPTFPKNYALGMAGVPFGVYFTVSFLFTAFYAASFIVLGESIFDRDFGTAGIAAGVLVLAGVGLLVYRLRRARRRAAKDPAAPISDPAP